MTETAANSFRLLQIRRAQIKFDCLAESACAFLNQARKTLVDQKRLLIERFFADILGNRLSVLSLTHSHLLAEAVRNGSRVTNDQVPPTKNA